MASNWILVSQPGNVVLEVEVDTKAKGQQCLDKVCELLGIHEIDYFGLQFGNRRGENLWLNMRNPIREQLPGVSPIRLKLRFKFPVPPHLLLQDNTRVQLYLNIREDYYEGKLRLKYEDAVKLGALFIQADSGDFENTNGYSVCALAFQSKYFFKADVKSSSSSEPSVNGVSFVDGYGCSNISENFVQDVAYHHSNIKGMSSVAAQNAALKLASMHDSFGVEYFNVRLDGEIIKLGIGPHGLHLGDAEGVEILYNIPYTSITVATQKEKQVLLTHLICNGEESKSQSFRLETVRKAAAVYRAIIEKHAFYSCETVRNNVTAQYIRDLKGTIASIFNENTPLGKNYMFDVRHTFREVYDNTRRYLYKMESASNQANISDDEAIDDKATMELSCSRKSCQAIHERLVKLEDSMLCRMCRDADICIAFFPCRHVISCEHCSELCDDCPICRHAISQKQHIYLPMLTHNDLKSMEILPSR